METCFECGSDSNIVNHHVVPQSRGGTKTIPLCQVCHDKVHGHKTPRDISVSQLTKEGMERARARGAKIGCTPDEAPKLVRAMNIGATRKKEEFCKKIMPLVEQLQKNGCDTLQSIANELNRQRIPTRTGKTWHAGTVFNLFMANLEVGKKTYA
jgi:hypothetical protein